MDGSLAEERTGDKVFHFRVPLEGTVTVEARAGACKDHTVFYKTEAPNPAYRLGKKKSSSANWV